MCFPSFACANERGQNSEENQRTSFIRGEPPFSKRTGNFPCEKLHNSFTLFCFLYERKQILSKNRGVCNAFWLRLYWKPTLTNYDNAIFPFPQTQNLLKILGPEGIRTPDNSHAKRVLYQLSYRPGSLEMGMLGVEPRTTALSVQCSTTELHAP